MGDPVELKYADNSKGCLKIGNETGLIALRGILIGTYASKVYADYVNRNNFDVEKVCRFICERWSKVWIPSSLSMKDCYLHPPQDSEVAKIIATLHEYCKVKYTE